MTTKFFTNKNENTLLNKFEGIFKHTKVHYFDVLVGYFRSSGYFRIRNFLDDVSKIRILVGINVDGLIGEAARKGLEFNFNADITREEFLRKLKEDIQTADYTKEVEDGILQFIKDIASGKIEIKAHPSKNIHAKIYIFRQEHEHTHAGYGAVITGSSNLTQAGIESNFEFNVELRDYDDIKFASETFELLWNESINITTNFIEELKTSTYLNDEFSPFEIYIKFLIEYFGKSIEYDPESLTDLPKGYKKLAYQIDAVNDGFNKLIKHNGFILADVVGLGKTIIATMIAKKFYFTNGYRTKTLVVHPPALKPNWTRTIRDFEIPNVEFCSNGSIQGVKHPEDYDLIIVDEAHKFRSDESEMFNNLQKLCKTKRKRAGYDGSIDKKVILITATPLNNEPTDIRNQIYLFQDSKLSTLEVGNIQHFFRPLIDKYDKLKKEKDKVLIKEGVQEIYEQIRTKILEPIIVRRTRTDILKTEQYLADMTKQGLTFPVIEKPRQVLYQLDEHLNKLYDVTLALLKDTTTGIQYMRYQAIKHLPQEVKDKYYNKRADVISDSLAKIMKTLLVKRIDSSFHAFRESLRRYFEANTAMLKMIENDKIYIAPKLKVNELVLNDDEEELERLLEDDPDKIQVFKCEDFNAKFITGIRHDQKILEYLYGEWVKVKQDPKLDEFLNKLKTELFSKSINDNGKLVIFSESKETTTYLRDQLKDHFKKEILCIDSSNQSDYADIIRLNFDANVSIAESKNDYDIIITTEVLAEGVNLHRINIVVNYDVPWNATRLMQRIGRVNRIGTPSEKIYIYNFFPTVKTDKEIDLNKKAYMKLQAFHSALGEDSQIYSTDEEFESFGLFEKVPEEGRDERLEFLQELRKFREENPDEFKKIRNMPKRARVGRKDKTNRGSTITFLKNKSRDSFYFIFDDVTYEELTFVEAAKKFRAHISEKPIPIHHKHHIQVDAAMKAFNDEIFIKALGDKSKVKLGPNESKAITFINTFTKLSITNELECESMELAIKAIRRGTFQKLPREINKLEKKLNKATNNLSQKQNELLILLKQYPLKQAVEEEIEIHEPKEVKKNEKLEPEIIISESFAL